jgi:hypothetical protein
MNEDKALARAYTATLKCYGHARGIWNSHLAKVMRESLQVDGYTVTPTPTDLEYAVTYGGPDPESCAGFTVYSDEAEAIESAQWMIDSSVWRRAVMHGQWQPVTS